MFGSSNYNPILGSSKFPLELTEANGVSSIEITATLVANVVAPPNYDLKILNYTKFEV